MADTAYWKKRFESHARSITTHGGLVTFCNLLIVRCLKFFTVIFSMP